jgi:ribonuclease Z
MADKAYLVQRFARIALGQIHLVGYSVAGEETLVQVPELNVCFDIGRAPYFALTSDIVCITHAHMDHIAGVPYYLSQRAFQGMKPGTVLVPNELYRPLENLLHCWRDVERQATPYTLVGLSPGDVHEVRRDFAIRCFATHHGAASLGYSLISVREKLLPQYVGTPGPELVALKERGVEIQYRLEVPLVAYLGDTTMGAVFDHPDVQNAEVLVTECTFFDADHKAKAKAGRHLHVDHLVQAMPRLKNRDIVLVHVSRRTSIGRARGILRRQLGQEGMKRIHFLMDLEGAKDAGDVDSVLPPPPDSAE